MLITVDSSVVIASLIKEEKFHEQCKTLMDKIFDAEHDAVMPYSVIVEVAGGMKRRTDSEELAERACNDLKNSASVHFIELTEEAALRAAETARKFGFRGMDALVVQTAKDTDAALVTLDEPMSKIAKNIVKVASVEEVIAAKAENSEEDEVQE